MQKLEADTQNSFGNYIKDKIIGLEKEKRERSELHFPYEKIQTFPLFRAFLIGGIRIQK